MQRCRAGQSPVCDSGTLPKGCPRGRAELSPNPFAGGVGKRVGGNDGMRVAEVTDADRKRQLPVRDPWPCIDREWPLSARLAMRLLRCESGSQDDDLDSPILPSSLSGIVACNRERRTVPL